MGWCLWKHQPTAPVQLHIKQIIPKHLTRLPNTPVIKTLISWNVLRVIYALEYKVIWPERTLSFKPEAL